jgi:hypothetical protein
MKAPVLTTLVQALRSRMDSEYRRQLGQLGFKGKKLDDLAAGFADGMTAMLHALIEAEIIEVVKPLEEGAE